VLWIKICGTTNLDDARASLDAGANALGFILAASPRQITAEAAAAIICELPPSIEKIGVVVNETPETLRDLVAATGLTGVQLHGDEGAEKMAEFRRALGLRRIIKTLHARELLAEPSKLDAYLDHSAAIDAFLLDSGSVAVRGGTGQTFDWQAALQLVERIKQRSPVIIGGGLNPDNVAEAIRQFDPCGVEVVTGVELSPGRKDPAKLRAFISAARAATNSISHTRDSSRGVSS
jgi:phosphoribosylanthranilate isomerase